MAVVVWVVEGTWPACVDAARVHTPDDTEIILLHVSGADVPLVLARGHLGPRSLGHASRFVVDHAPCPVLLVWPPA